ncbi:MAG TPA: non-canonical purine NTP pyrophosphatase, RdgB/HAM1 family [Alphaproteobacteria bacterium]|nr:non-canonical purine NTP pyrophosphatase, RdgB/HAM1 family [Alphaproteobacteria bacterium]HAJ47973.1 non-canonical purine NTP pyrophosphatase, RdgB/HAM1 family [Alphaproteobacteria bacterium]
MARKVLEPQLVVATHNPGKLKEIRELLAPFPLAVTSAGLLGLPEPEETETTFEGNARIKALAAACASGLPALADDSGFCVEALDGEPGVYSANWAGPGKDFNGAMARVQEGLEARGIASSPAHFVCVLAMAWPDEEVLFFRGETHGHTAWPMRGSKGFGFDPMFVPDGHTRTFGEMEYTEKLPLTHRARAFEKLVKACFA